MTVTKMVSATDLAYVRNLLHEQAGIAMTAEKDYLVRARLESIARARGLDGPTEVVDALRSTPLGPLHWEVIEAHTINETSFFRAPHVFDEIAEVILPPILDARARVQRLRIWSAACSTGQEPYSLAMMLRERFPMLGRWDVQIVGTDLCTSALRRTEAGTYTDLEVSRGLPDDIRNRYFTRSGSDWRLAFTIRQMVSTQRVNLTARFPALPRFDLVLLRNVLIYFDQDTRRDVLQRIGDQAMSDGALVLGETETSLDRDVPFARVTSERAVHYRFAQPDVPRSGPQPLPATADR